MINMNLLAVVTPPSIYQVVYGEVSLRGGGGGSYMFKMSSVQ